MREYFRQCENGELLLFDVDYQCGVVYFVSVNEKKIANNWFWIIKMEKGNIAFKFLFNKWESFGIIILSFFFFL